MSDAKRNPHEPPLAHGHVVHLIDQQEWFRAEQVLLTSPVIVNLKIDPFKRFIDVRGYDEWAENRGWICGPAGGQIAKFVGTFRDYPPSQKSMSVQVSNVSQFINAQVPGR